MASVKDSSSAAESDESPPRCDVCLRRASVFFQKSHPIFDGKDVLIMITKYLDIEIKLTLVCRSCWTRLREFDEFYRMVNEQHQSQTDLWQPDGKEEPFTEEQREERLMGMEFVEIKLEPAVEDTSECVNEKKEPFPDGDDLDKLSIEQQAMKMDDEEEALLDEDNNSFSSDDSYDSSASNRVKRKGKALTVKKEPKVDTEILEFYKRLVCEVCDAERMLAGEASIEYGNLRELNKHMRKVHDHRNKPAWIKCPMCEKKFRYRAKLLEHRDMHLNPDRFRCAVCAEVHQNMAEHMKNKHQERTYCCEECGKRFPFKARLTAHIKKMHTSKDVVCEQCQKSFSRYTIDDHRRAVHDSRFMCEHCPRTFKSRIALSQHMEEHVEGLRVTVAATCEQCGLVLRDKYTLQTHIKRVHTEHSPVNCGTCGKVFKSKHNLNAHLANVCTERSFPCPICGKQFKKKIKLTEHMTTHTKSALYQCAHCPKTFSFETQMYTHRKQAHHEQWLEMQRKRKEGVRFKVNRIKDTPSGT